MNASFFYYPIPPDCLPERLYHAGNWADRESMFTLGLIAGGHMDEFRNCVFLKLSGPMSRQWTSPRSADAAYEV